MRNRSTMIRALLLSVAVAAAWGCVSQDRGAADVAESRQLVEDGREAARRRSFTEAGRLFTQAVQVNPDNAEAWYERARCSVQVRLDRDSEGDSRAHEQRALDDYSM